GIVLVLGEGELAGGPSDPVRLPAGLERQAGLAGSSSASDDRHADGDVGLPPEHELIEEALAANEGDDGMTGAQEITWGGVLGVPDELRHWLDDREALPATRALRCLLSLQLGGDVPGGAFLVVGGVTLGQAGQLTEERGDGYPEASQVGSIRSGAVYQGDDAGRAVVEQGAAAEAPENLALPQPED